MTLYFKTKRLQKQCSEAKTMNRDFGKQGSLKLMQRLMELQAAATLKDVSHLPLLGVMNWLMQREYSRLISCNRIGCFSFLQTTLCQEWLMGESINHLLRKLKYLPLKIHMIRKPKGGACNEYSE